MKYFHLIHLKIEFNPMRLSFLFAFLCAFTIAGCGKFDPSGSDIEPTSDGNYVVESSESDTDLLKKGFIVVYRFQSVNNLVAVRQLSQQKITSTYSAPHVAAFIQQNKRTRSENPVVRDVAQLQDETMLQNCNAAYCEAKFDQAKKFIAQKNIRLKPVPIAVIDSGVLPATQAIESILSSTLNMTEDKDVSRWLPHATMISSIFAGVMNSPNTMPIDTYAPNAKIHSVKVTFASDSDTMNRHRYGSMQLAVALDQAVAQGARIVNLSLTYTRKPDDSVIFAEKGVIAAGAKKGVIFVVAAGNNNADLEKTAVYPAAYDADNMIVAGSHTALLQKAFSSNYGGLVDLSAQGAAIAVNDKSGRVSVAGGTSFAAPLVVSALCLYEGIVGEAALPDAKEVVQDLLVASTAHQNKAFTVGPGEAGFGKAISRYGRLDVLRVVQKAYAKRTLQPHT